MVRMQFPILTRPARELSVGIANIKKSGFEPMVRYLSQVIGQIARSQSATWGKNTIAYLYHKMIRNKDVKYNTNKTTNENGNALVTNSPQKRRLG